MPGTCASANPILKLMPVPAASWPEAAVKARYLLKLCAASLPAEARGTARCWQRCSTISSGSARRVEAKNT